MTANDMSIDIDETLGSREHAARAFTEARRRQLELALEGRLEESAAYAQMAATARALLDELDELEPIMDEPFLCL